MGIEGKIEKSPEKERGKNIKLTASFFRHGERDIEGKLTNKGKEDAKEIAGIYEGKDVKFYTSTFDRCVETADAIANEIEKQSGEESRFKSRTRIEFAPPNWDGFDELVIKAKEIEKKDGQEGLFKYIFSEPSIQKDLRRWTSGLAFIVNRYINMSDRLYSNSDVELVNITHDMVIADFLRKVVINKDGQHLDVVKSVGHIKPLSGFQVVVAIDDKGKKSVKVLFNDKEYLVDEDALEELLDQFKEDPYLGREENKK